MSIAFSPQNNNFSFLEEIGGKNSETLILQLKH